MPRFTYSLPHFFLFVFFVVVPSYSVKLSEVKNVPTFKKGLGNSNKKILSTSIKERKPATEKSELNWKKNVKSYYGNSIVQLDGTELSKYEVYKELYEALYHLAEEKNPGSGNGLINKYLKLLMDENEELERKKKETWKTYKEEEKKLNNSLNQAKKIFESDAVKSEEILKAKILFEDIIYGPGGILDVFKSQRVNIFRERSFKAYDLFDGYELEVEELFIHYNERWQAEYGLKNFEDKIYDLKIQTLNNVPNFYLSFSESEFDLYLDQF